MSEPKEYSDTIMAEEYNRMISDEHIYIAASDGVIAEILETEGAQEVVDVGCGPGRMLETLSEVDGIKLTGVDKDRTSIEYTRRLARDLEVDVELVEDDISTYEHSTKVDAFVSSGVDHHMPEGYMSNLFKQLRPGGVYIMADEILPAYRDETQRRQRAVVWYSHVIASALEDNFGQLADEEAHTLLDDLNTGRLTPIPKTRKQLDLILQRAGSINNDAISSEITTARKKVRALLAELIELTEQDSSADVESFQQSRGDYKVSDEVIRTRAITAGFDVERVERIGPQGLESDIGCMAVYVLRKPVEEAT
jgi:SAM-dependent methyltransferase